MSEANLTSSTMSNRTKIIMTVGLVTAILFLFSGNEWIETISKPIPVLCMAFWLVTQPAKERYQWAVIIGLLLSATADVVISFHFVAGVAVFPLAHLAYIAAFLQDSRKPFLCRADSAGRDNCHAHILARAIRHHPIGGLAKKGTL